MTLFDFCSVTGKSVGWITVKQAKVFVTLNLSCVCGGGEMVIFLFSSLRKCSHHFGKIGACCLILYLAGNTGSQSGYLI